MRKNSSVLAWIIIFITGIAAGLSTIYILPSQWEIFLWILIIAGIGLLTKKQYPDGLFNHAFRYAMVVGITITITHLKFIDDYLGSHPDERLMIENTFATTSKEVVLLLFAPIYWVLLGLFSGLAALVWKKLL